MDIHIWGHGDCDTGDTCMGTWGVRGDAYRGVAGGTLLSLERSTYMGRGNGCSRVVHTEGRGWHTSLAREEYIHFSRKGGVHTWRRGRSTYMEAWQW